jgi:hypothetical protein
MTTLGDGVGSSKHGDALFRYTPHPIDSALLAA